jgi:CheY-like chemotaxis protein
MEADIVDDADAPVNRSLICLVDDSQDNRVLLTAVLERAGMAVIAVADCRALDEVLATQTIPDLFVLDLALPGESGVAILQRLRGDPRCAGVPMLACTAHAMAGDAERGLADGFDAYLTKPIDIVALVGVVSGFLDQHGGRRPAG